MNVKPVFYVIGILLCILAGSMVFPMLTDLYAYHSDWKVFLGCLIATFFFGGLLILTNKTEKLTIRIREGFLLTSLSWVSLGLFGALPFWFSELQLDFTDAVFESVSGITTTGATIIAGLDESPPGLLLWRAILQWLGGIGIIVMALSLLPFLGIGGMQLFRTESSESEKALPRTTELAKNISLIYIGLTIACMVFYMFTGLGLFEAVCHALTTISTGGFSTHDTSFMDMGRIDREIVCTLFMLSGSIPFVLYLKFLRGDRNAILQDEQVRWYLIFLAASILVLSVWLVIFNAYTPLQALRYTSFNIISLVTTTGFASIDYSLWGLFPIMFVFFLMFVGGCNGSTSGGIKFFRFQIAYTVTIAQLKKLITPHAYITPLYNNKPIPTDVPISVMSFFFIYAMTMAVLGCILAMTGLDFITAMSAAVTSISNVGPGLGPIIGPSGNYASLNDTAKWILSFGMISGRLELFTIMVMFLPRYWKP
ncbi:MAG: TrkH family potassium uptake protein [Rhodospirillales bacterium]|nr:TrkH family potassium uptake protein [Rhodospirillales bacterium]MCB9980374.1 TrkH family potassium uptake protein [Rhodospirillales bacterium]